MARPIKGIIDRHPTQLLVPIVDMITLVLGSLLAHLLVFGHVTFAEHYTLSVGIIALLLVVLNATGGGYQRWRIQRINTLLLRLTGIWLGGAIICLAVVYALDVTARYSPLWIFLSILFSLLIAGAGRIGVQLAIRHAWLSGLSNKKVFLVGPGDKVVAMGRRMRNMPEAGYVLGGVERIPGAPSEQDLATLARRVEEANIDEVWLCMSLDMGKSIRTILYALRHSTVEVRFIPSFSDMQLLHYSMGEVVGRTSIDLSVSPIKGMAWLAKRTEDLVVGSLICILITPVCLIIGLAIKITSPGPILFKQDRTGDNGQHFKVYKFRSMKVHQEKSNQITQATKGDSRLTPIGGFLRRTSLDELPQFLNVLQGNMSIVGPRPHALAHNDHYKELVELYMKRHKVKPGITGWAQVNGFRGETDTLDKMEARVRYDLWYINNWSVFLDLRIIIATVFKGFINKNAY